MTLGEDSVWLFPSPKGRRWDCDNFSAALRRAQHGCAREWSCLDFRHTFASHLAKKGVSIFKIAKLLGNTVPICERHYAHLSPAGLADEVEFHAGRMDCVPGHRPGRADAGSGGRRDDWTRRSEVARPSAAV
jgi:integrase